MISSDIKAITGFMVSLLLAKFVLNDIPHTLGLLNNPRVIIKAMISPAYNVIPGIYDWGYLARITPISAEHAVLYASIEGLLPLSSFKWKYYEIQLGKINSWVSTFANYCKYSSKEITEFVMEKRFNINDYYELSNEAEVWPKDIPLSSLEEFDRHEAFADWLERNLKQAERIKEEMISSKVYYPPILTREHLTLDGAHRAAILRSMYGPSAGIYVWEMI